VDALPALWLAAVLLIDDDHSIVEATTMLLESMGARVCSASNGDEALAQLAAGMLPDMLICDYRLPGYTGVELIRRIRQAALHELPSILVTGDASSAEIAAADLANCTILRKPVDTNRLISLIENLVA
jgi:two-component system CheB/CheR fusion protein